MTVRSIIKAAEWALAPETAEGAPAVPLYEAECTTCGDQSRVAEGDQLAPELWAMKHTGLNTTHRTYRAVITSFWRVSPAPGNPLHRGETGR
ncbi:hypothetical protein ABZW18_07175 [Streptomyces sp. NPDC004647]|uniref:DUF7848 domain-containing protein n=1 Tax=Streptomyces sp. NPDC004647 TaxID=3154671 RepID=UPI0033B7BA81